MRAIWKILIFLIKYSRLKILHWNGMKILSKRSLLSRCKFLSNFSIIGTSIIEIGSIECASNTHIASVAGGSITIADRCYINRNCTFVSRYKIVIGEGCTFGPNVCIYDHDHEFDKNGQNGNFKLGTVNIGKNCWIGSGAIILRNTNIGENSVIGAGCIIKGDIPKNSLVTSNQVLNIKPLHD